MMLITEDSISDGEEDFIFNEYAVDDTLDPLSRLQRYHTSDFSLQRLVLVKDLTDTAKASGFEESLRTMLPILRTFLSDAEPSVRHAFVNQLHPLAVFFVERGGEVGYEQVLQTLLPAVFQLLIDKNLEVCASAITTLTEIAKLVRPEHVEKELLSVVMSLARDERAEDYRVAAAQLFNDLAERFGPELCQTEVLNEVRLLSNDMSFTVRKAVGANLGEICRVLQPEEATESVLPIFLSLCSDEVWGVRKVCGENVVSVSQHITRVARTQLLVPAVRLLTEDTSRWVRIAAYQMLGQFLHTMVAEDISPMLLKLFTDMAFQSVGGDIDFSEFCAFSLPGVVQITGRDRWREVEDAYATMLRDVQWKVRKTLAYSVHELAIILGQEVTEHSLTVAFELFLRDLDEIKFGVVRGSDKFLSMCRPQTREVLAPMVCNVLLTSENWRLRNDIAERIGYIAQLLPPTSQAMREIVMLIIRLLDDSVSKVRQSTFRPAAQTLKHLAASEKEDLDGYVSQLMKLSESKSFCVRQMFAYVAQQVAMLDADALVERYFLERLVKLANDPVSNVRVVVARVMQETFAVMPRWKSDRNVLHIIGSLRKSGDLQ